MTTTDYQRLYQNLVRSLVKNGVKVPMNSWQSQATETRPGMSWSRELQFYTFRMRVPGTLTELQGEVQPNLPWAEDHFQERVSGKPLNPPPSEAWWPYRVQGNAEHKVDEKFSHTYPERMWPKQAHLNELSNDQWWDMHGIRYDYGDLADVVKQLGKDPLTRQAYLPIWFPEDTGAVQGQRVPCTLGYHFLYRPGYFPNNYVGAIVYYIRSCDLLRHFTDDVYMAARLLQWVSEMATLEGLPTFTPAQLVMHISSLHTFEGDEPRLNLMLADYEDDEVYGTTF